MTSNTSNGVRNRQMFPTKQGKSCANCKHRSVCTSPCTECMKVKSEWSGDKTPVEIRKVNYCNWEQMQEETYPILLKRYNILNPYSYVSLCHVCLFMAMDTCKTCGREVCSVHYRTQSNQCTDCITKEHLGQKITKYEVGYE